MRSVSRGFSLLSVARSWLSDPALLNRRGVSFPRRFDGTCRSCLTRVLTSTTVTSGVCGPQSSFSANPAIFLGVKRGIQHVRVPVDVVLCRTRLRGRGVASRCESSRAVCQRIHERVRGCADLVSDAESPGANRRSWRDHMGSKEKRLCRTAPEDVSPAPHLRSLPCPDHVGVQTTWSPAGKTRVAAHLTSLTVSWQSACKREGDDAPTPLPWRAKSLRTGRPGNRPTPRRGWHWTTASPRSTIRSSKRFRGFHE